MTISIAKTSFSGGEWAPSLHNRIELDKYNSAVKTMKNFILHPHGHAFNRGGTYYVGETKNSSKACRLIPFQFSVDDSYALEFGDQYMRVIRNGGYVLDGGSPYEISTPYLEADIFLINYEQDADILYLAHPSYAPRKLTRTAHDNWTLSIISFGADISAPANLTRDSGSGTGNNYVVTAVNSLGEESVASTAVTDNGPGDTWTWDAVTGAEYYNFYKDSFLSGIYGWIGRATSETFKEPTDGIEPDYTKGVPYAKTIFNASDDYPGCVSLFQQRLLWARTNNEPYKIWGSLTANHENHNYSIPLLDNDAFIFSLYSPQINEIRSIVDLKDLIVGTSGSIWKMNSGINKDAITPTSVKIAIQSNRGMSDLNPIPISGSLFFVDGARQSVRNLERSIDLEGYDVYTDNNFSILSNHLFDDYTIVDWTYEQYPYSIIWCIRSDGKLLGMTYLKEQAIWGWHQHETDGYFESIATILDTDGVNETYFVVRRTINGSTKRYIEMFKPRLPVDDSYNPDIQDAFFVDCGLSLDSPISITGATKANPVVITATSHGLSTNDYVDISEINGMTELNGNQYQITKINDNSFSLNNCNGSNYTAYTSGGYARKAVINISGLGHLEGKAVSVLANGSSITGKMVSSGAITLPNRASRVHVGLGYVCDLETLDFNFQARDGITLDKIKNIKTVFLKYINTYSLNIGPDENNLVTIDFSDAVYTGEREIPIFSGNIYDCRVFMRVTEPLPATILAIVARLNYDDR